MMSGHMMREKEVIKVFGNETIRQEIREGMEEFKSTASHITYLSHLESIAQ
jgi:hypothetical protein